SARVRQWCSCGSCLARFVDLRAQIVEVRKSCGKHLRIDVGIFEAALPEEQMFAAMPFSRLPDQAKPSARNGNLLHSRICKHAPQHGGNGVEYQLRRRTIASHNGLDSKPMRRLEGPRMLMSKRIEFCATRTNEHREPGKPMPNLD